jgi:hypothetical protein
VANVVYTSVSETFADAAELAPGDVRLWWANGFFNYGDAISVTAHSVILNPGDPPGDIAVQDVRIDASSDGGHTLLFTVKNVGSSFIPGYRVGIGVIQP